MPSWLNKALHAVAAITVAAGSVASLSLTGIAIPAVVIGVATKVAAVGAVVGVVAAKIAPGLWGNAPTVIPDQLVQAALTKGKPANQ